MTGIDSNLNSNVPLRRLALRCGRVFDGSGADPVEDAVVVVEGERIAAVGPESQVSIDPADEMIDLRPCTLLPGLIDAHVHLWGRSPGDAMPWASGPIEYRALRSANEARKLLEAGFTAVRDLGSQTSVVVKRAIDDGVALGPRMKAAGMAIARTGGPWFGIDPSWRWARPAEGIDECRRAVHLSIREGSSVIKIGTSTSHEPGGAWGEVPTYTVGEIEAMTTEAHKWGSPGGCSRDGNARRSQRRDGWRGHGRARLQHRRRHAWPHRGKGRVRRADPPADARQSVPLGASRRTATRSGH